MILTKNFSEKKSEVNLPAGQAGVNLPQGIYQLSIETNYGTFNKKLIIQ